MEKSELDSYKLSFLWEHTIRRMVKEKPEWVFENRLDWLYEYRPEWLFENKLKWLKEHRPELFLDRSSELALSKLTEELEKDESN